METNESFPIRRAGDHLTELLKKEITIRYNANFYRDGDDELWQELAIKFGIDPDGIAPAIIVEVAMAQLEKKGFVVTKQLPDRMGDGEPDYTITLTDKGREFFASGKPFRYHDMDL